MESVLKYIDDLVKEYNYKALPYDVSVLAKEFYQENLPIPFMQKENHSLYSLQNTLLSTGYDRIVIGDYGAYIEIPKTDMIIQNIHMPKEQTYRLMPKYFNNIKYLWYTANDFSKCKIYYQIRKVIYADYQPGYFYISPYEVKVGEI